MNKELVEDMKFYVYGGPTYDNKALKPFNWDSIIKNDYHLKFIQGVPKLWVFKPFYYQ